MELYSDEIEKRELYERARKLGIIFSSHTSKVHLIRNIQSKEGHYPCFGSDEREFCVGGCEWEADCKSMLIAAWKR